MTNKIVFTLQVDFAMPEVAYARGDHHEFICFCEYLLWVKENEVNYLALLSQRVQRSERGLNICRPSKEHVSNARITSLVGK